MPATVTRIGKIELHVGRRIRERRLELGMTQQQLARLLGITYQQTHKYERGMNRISAGRLYQLAQVLSVEVSYFFQGLGDAPVVAESSRLGLEVARNFARIEDARCREALAQLCRALAEEEELAVARS